MDVHKASQRIKSPATLQVGTEDASAIVEIIQGTVSLNFPSVPATSQASASAAVAGLSAAHRVMIFPQGAAYPVWVAAAVGIAGGVQATAFNASGSAVDPAAANMSFWAFR